MHRVDRGSARVRADPRPYGYARGDEQVPVDRHDHRRRQRTDARDPSDRSGATRSRDLQRRTLRGRHRLQRPAGTHAHGDRRSRAARGAHHRPRPVHPSPRDRFPPRRQPRRRHLRGVAERGRRERHRGENQQGNSDAGSGLPHGRRDGGRIARLHRKRQQQHGVGARPPHRKVHAELERSRPAGSDQRLAGRPRGLGGVEFHRQSHGDRRRQHADGAHRRRGIRLALPCVLLTRWADRDDSRPAR